MKDLTKSCFSFAWAMSLLGLEQMGNLLGSERSGNRKERLSTTFDTVTKATEEQLGERTQKLFDSGDKLQRELFDLVFDVARIDNLKPKKVLDRAADLADKAADSLRDAGKEKESADIADAPAQPA